ncbi:MAG TPA: hypothetical protein VLF89_09225 [Candidatus Saccharimonadales bacterium]|nr:hypothetical protein [Candidatus Saccharimonadales bacterium]
MTAERRSGAEIPEYYMPSRDQITSANPEVSREQIGGLLNGVASILPHFTPRLDKSYSFYLSSPNASYVSLMGSLNNRRSNSERLLSLTLDGGNFKSSPDGISLELDKRGKLSARNEDGEEADLSVAVNQFIDYFSDVPRILAEKRIIETRELEQRKADQKIAEGELITPLFSELSEFSGDASRLYDMWAQDPVPIPYNPSELIDHLGMSPKFTQQIGENTLCHFSQAVIVDSRPYVLGFIEREGKVYPSMFYISNSQAAWRWLPGIDPATGYHGKGDDENAMTLPYPLQKSLRRILQAPGTEEIDMGRMSILLLAVTHRVKRDDILSERAEAKHFRYRSLHFAQDTQYPETVDEGEKPNFSEKIDNWIFSSDLYGEVTVDVFASRNGELTYGFMRNREGQAWIGFIDINNAQLRRAGVRTERAKIENRLVSSPAYEYKDQAGQRWGKQADRPNTDNPNFREFYVDAFAHSLSNVPVIQEYYRTIPRDEIEWGYTIPLNRQLNTHLFEFRGFLKWAHENEQTLFTDAILDFTEAMPSMLQDLREDMANDAGKLFTQIKYEFERIKCGDTSPKSLDSFNPREIGSIEYDSFSNLLLITGFEMIEEKPERYDPHVFYRYFKSPKFPEVQVFVAVKDETLMEYGVIPA